MTLPGSRAAWYPDPTRRFELRYFDGSRWTDHVASGEVSAFDPLPDPGSTWSTRPANPQGALRPTPPRHRARRTILIVVAVAVALVAGVTALIVVNRTVFTNRLLTVDFRHGPGPFVNRETPDFSLDVADGMYRIRSRTADAGAARSFAYFARRAYEVDISAGVVSVSPDSIIGVGCLSRVSPIEGYVLMVTTSGGVALARLNNNSPAGNQTDPIAADEHIAVPTGNFTFRLACNPNLVGSSVSLKGYLNGQEVITGRDEHGLDGFDAGLLVFENPASGAEVRFSRVEASVSGTGTSK